MYSMEMIRPVGRESSDRLLEVLHESFSTVAVEFGLSRENNPSNGAFIGKRDLEVRMEKGLVMFGYFEKGDIVGCVGIKQSDKGDVFYIEKLCVSPSKRHSGIGFDLLQFAENEIRNRDGKRVSVGIISENTRLKAWYEKNGYSEYELKSYEHLPFKVSLMKKEI
jgi:diamine N-acetyltransferase